MQCNHLVRVTSADCGWHASPLGYGWANWREIPGSAAARADGPGAGAAGGGDPPGIREEAAAEAGGEEAPPGAGARALRWWKPNPDPLVREGRRQILVVCINQIKPTKTIQSSNKNGSSPGVALPAFLVPAPSGFPINLLPLFACQPCALPMPRGPVSAQKAGDVIARAIEAPLEEEPDPPLRQHAGPSVWSN